MKGLVVSSKKVLPVDVFVRRLLPVCKGDGADWVNLLCQLYPDYLRAFEKATATELKGDWTAELSPAKQQELQKQMLDQLGQAAKQSKQTAKKGR